MDDRRSWLRFEVQIDVKIRKLDGQSDNMDATIVDVSFGGIGIITNHELDPGTEIEIEWQNPPFYYSGDAIARGTVINVISDAGKDGSVRLNIKFSDSATELTQSLVSWAQKQSAGQKKVTYY